jgi:hypothetical protein
MSGYTQSASFAFGRSVLDFFLFSFFRAAPEKRKPMIEKCPAAERPELEDLACWYGRFATATGRRH